MEVTLKTQQYANTAVSESQAKQPEQLAKAVETTATSSGDRVTISEKAMALSLTSDDGTAQTNNTGIEPPSDVAPTNTGIEPPNTGIEPPTKPPSEPAPDSTPGTGS